MSRTTKLVSLFLIAFIAFSIWAKHRYGSALDAVQYWLTFGKKAELQEKYPTIGDQEVERIIVKQISGDAKCLDSYNNLEIASPFHQLFVEKSDGSTMEPITWSFGLDTGEYDLFKNNFDKKSLPETCVLLPFSNPDMVQPQSNHKLEGRCTRRDTLSELLSEVIGPGYFSITDETGATVGPLLFLEKDYTVSCNLTVTKVSPCLSSDYAPVTGTYNIAEYLLKQFYQHNFCDHPKHEEFVSQVRDKWSNALKKK